MIGKDGREIMPYCITCGMRKTPYGRSAPLEMATGLCDWDCDGYLEEPLPSQYWSEDDPTE